MENKPKKSKALIITFIVVLLLLIAGYFLLFKSDGGSSSGSSAKIFSSLFSSKNKTDDGTLTMAIAGEEIKDKNSIYVSGYAENTESVPVVFKVDPNDPNSSNPNNVYGVANQDIKTDKLGRVTITTTDQNGKKVIAQAGEDIKEGDQVYISNYIKYTQKIPIIMNMVSGDTTATKNTILGFANEGIRLDNLGEVTLTSGGTSNSFWDSFFGFLGKKTDPKIDIPAYVNPQINIENGVWKTGDPFKDSRVTIEDNVWKNTDPANGVVSLENGIWTLNKSMPENGVWELVNGVWTRIEVGVFGKIDPYRFPVVTVVATPSSFDSEGTSKISWTSTNSTSCNAGPNNGTGTSGSFSTGLLKKSKMFTVVCTGDSGVSSGNAFVIVGGNTSFPEVTVTANPSSFDTEGVSTISWSSKNTVSCNAGAGNSTATSGSFKTGLLTESRSFSVTCTGVNGSISGNTSVIITNSNSSNVVRQCSDGIDNDGDGKSDKDDPNCHLDGDLAKDYVANHFSEATSPDSKVAQCSDGKDNDGDGKADVADPNCHVDGSLAKAYVPTHFSESSSPLSTNAQCSDGKDNDGDKSVDARDPNCHVDGDLSKAYIPTHFSESSSPISTTSQCSDGKDNDGDVLVDARDPNCHVDGDLSKDYIPSHFSEASSPIGSFGQCSDKKDNDDDKLADIKDPECHLGGVLTGLYVADHYTEAAAPFDDSSQCSDGKDNDKDSLIDSLDPQCHEDGDLTKPYIPTHYSELNAPPASLAQCSDGIDNDGEGDIDVEDPNCHIGGVLTGTYIPTHFSEKYSPSDGTAQCSDSKDNDGDGNTDEKDPNCHVGGVLTGNYIATHNSESGSPTQCDDTKDNDGDKLIDILDPNCHIDGDLNNAYLPSHTSEAFSPGGVAQCNDGKDNDGDSTIDILDPNCHIDGDLKKDYVPTHFSELSSPTQCSDAKDNDGDKKIDKDDPQCHIGGVMTGDYVATHNSESNSPAQCSDGADNDNDKLADALDPQCHEGGDLTAPYVADHDSESIAPEPANKCAIIDQNPLTFTDVEKAKLAELLRKFYIIASTLKTDDDIKMIYNEIDRYKELIGRLDEITKECYAELSDPKYNGPKTQYGNPWFKYNERDTYLSGGGATTRVQTVNSECVPGGDIGHGDYNCTSKTNSTFSPMITSLYCRYYDPFGKNYANDCKWVPKVNLEEYEAILNIW